MRRSPRRPLILKRRKLPFQLNDPPANVVPSKEPYGRPPPTPTPHPNGPFPTAIVFPDGIQVVSHPTRPDTQVVVIPKTADLQCVIGALTAKGKEHGPNGPNKFILLSGSSGGLENDSHFVHLSEGDGPPPQRITGGPPGNVKEEGVCLDIKPLTGLNPFNKDLDCSPLDDSLTNMQWLGRMSTDTEKSEREKENYSLSQQESQETSDSMVVEVEGGGEAKATLSDRPPYSYMAMIQFAINSRPGRRMTLKEIYNWIEDHFPFFQQQTKPGWKNSIRHNLSLHDMFTRETSPDGKVSYWTIRPETDRCLTLDQVVKPGYEGTVTLVPASRSLVPRQEQTGMLSSSTRSVARGCVRRMKPLLPRSDSYLVPFQLPAATTTTTSIFLPTSYSPQVQLRPAPQRTRDTPRANKRVRIAPKQVAHVDAPAVPLHPTAKEFKEEPACLPLTPRRAPRQGGGGGGGGGGGSSRRKQRLVLPAHEEPVLLFQDSSFFDSGVASDASGLQDTQPELSFKTPVKGSSSSLLASSTPSKPAGWEPWKVTPLGKGTQRAMLDFSPIRTPSGPLHTPRHTPQQQQQQQQQHLPLQDYSSFSFSFNGTSFTELPLFSSPRELLTACGRDSSPVGAGRSLEGLMLDTMNDSLSKVLVDISFSGLEDEDLGTANISWSEFIPQML
ncbi:forkhead box protein M1 isoform X1 [Gadus morhua]|uniref:forkhead box protein M1 isoform X1 n=1 Tax=Gadus morhua TaxID=8049 RepID=UPI0011B595E3|nr:forkhead box protein M1 isoform X1 [Gadus morhua]